MEGHFGAEDAGHQFVISDELNLTVAGVNQKDPWWNAPRVGEPCVRSQCKVLSLEITVHFYTLWKTQQCSFVIELHWKRPTVILLKPVVIMSCPLQIDIVCSNRIID